MSESDKVFAGAIPDIYDEYLVPLIFETYARDMAARVAGAVPGAVLETAAGSGVVTRALAPRLDASARYVVTDLNGPMLDRAAARQPDPARCDWQPADALALPFADRSFDAVCCQFGVMFFPDKVKGYAEARRVLSDGGRFVFSVWDRIEENVFAESVTRTITRLFPDDPPLFLARTPHGYHDRDRIRAELKQAGFRDIEIDTVAGVSAAADAHVPAVAYCQGTPLRNEIEKGRALTLAEITDCAAEDLALRYGSGRIEGKIQAHVIVATA